MSNKVNNFEDLVSEWLDKLDDLESEEALDDQTTVSKPGKLAVVNGNLKMEKPQRHGMWPTIEPGKDNLVKIMHKGRVITRPTVVETVDDIQLEVAHRSPQSSFEISISRDKMEVWLTTEFSPGAEYEICDADYATRLVVWGKQVREIPPEPIDVRLVLERLRELGIRAEVSRAAVEEACSGMVSDSWLIAKGVPPEPPIDGRVEVVCDLTVSKRTKEPGERIDFLDRGVINSVEPGEVLAYWHPPVEGKPGTDVYGNVVEPRPPKHARFLVGTGVKLMDNGRIAVAEIAGRPCFEYNRLCVRSQLVIPGDVDVKTGNIEFKGDVIVLGDVHESLTIKAGGMVEVKGSVFHARIIAGSRVMIHKNLIGGHVSVGGDLAVYMKIVALLKRICPELRKLHNAVIQLKNHPRFSVEDLKERGDGYLIKLILEMRFAEIPKLFQELIELLPQMMLPDEDGELEIIQKVLQTVGKRFIGASPLSIGSISEVEKHIDHLTHVRNRLEDILDTPADVEVNYCQNARLDATGSITVTGSLVYGCDMTAGRDIQILGECRGGKYTAKSSISARSAGLNETVRTYWTVDEGGSLCAGTFRPGVWLTIGQGRMAVNETYYNVEFRYDGRWIRKDCK